MGDDDTTWVFESLVGFLRGPVWNVPLLTFVENKSLIFEPDCPNDDDHTNIHDEYKNLVDFMLGSYMEDIGIGTDQFEAACGKGTSEMKEKIHQTLFEQVWAADDYEIFQRMMIQKNLELQLQALALLQQKYGIVPESFVPGGDDLTTDEKTVMEEVIKKSLEEHSAYREEIDQDQQEYVKALALSQKEKHQLEEEVARANELLMEAVTKAPEDRAAPAPTESVKPTNTIDPEELEKRQTYLREQRDKLLALKKVEREKQLSTYEEAAPQTRPKSSKAARKMILDHPPECTAREPSQSAATVMKGVIIGPQALQARKALAERLKNEVIDRT